MELSKAKKVEEKSTPDLLRTYTKVAKHMLRVCKEQQIA